MSTTDTTVRVTKSRKISATFLQHKLAMQLVKLSYKVVKSSGPFSSTFLDWNCAYSIIFDNPNTVPVAQQEICILSTGPTHLFKNSVIQQTSNSTKFNIINTISSTTCFVHPWLPHSATISTNPAPSATSWASSGLTFIIRMLYTTFTDSSQLSICIVNYIINWYLFPCCIHLRSVKFVH